MSTVKPAESPGQVGSVLTSLPTLYAQSGRALGDFQLVKLIIADSMAKCLGAWLNVPNCADGVTMEQTQEGLNGAGQGYGLYQSVGGRRRTKLEEEERVYGNCKSTIIGRLRIHQIQREAQAKRRAITLPAARDIPIMTFCVMKSRIEDVAM
ncbi:hypothetical protein DL98DRAFT_589066 [Cadophora sp. DSE1049]|nr:hypothetical protein DL98DRAFT_589066 [Cadophora sp. DSE1049]